VAFSLDDFGTGYSSLSYLKRLPLEQLKIDQSFVREVLTNANDQAIETIVALASSLGLRVIAEGVETAAQRDFLDANGCHAWQGYLFSPAVPVAQFEAWVAQFSGAWIPPSPDWRAGGAGHPTGRMVMDVHPGRAGTAWQREVAQGRRDRQHVFRGNEPQRAFHLLCMLWFVHSFTPDIAFCGGSAFPMRTFALYLLTALAEIVGCYLPWLWLRQGSAWAVAAAASLGLFALAAHLAP
jgi:hypothetical protein